MFDNYDNILNVADVAKALKIGNTQAYKLVRSGKLPAFKEGRAWKISKQSLTQYVQQNIDCIRMSSHLFKMDWLLMSILLLCLMATLLYSLINLLERWCRKHY